jgi:alpha-mannosidase
MPTDNRDLPHAWNRREFMAALTVAAVAGSGRAGAGAHKPREVFIVPNFHPASCGWLTTFSKERVYCANSYLSHLDRVRDDPNYSFVMSEVNNIIAIMEFQPARIPELKQRIQEKRVELVNGYFLESAINLAGGEALVRQGVEGLRWYQKVFGVTPRFSWNIDVVGTHDQMPQIAAGLGLEALVYTRKNPTGKTIYWSESPDGTRILTLSPGGYSEAQPIFSSKSPLTTGQLHDLEKFFDGKEPITPEGAPILILGGGDDYSIAPLVKQYPSLLEKQLAETDPDRKLKFATMSQYLDAIQPAIQSGSTKIPTLNGGTAYDYDAFWIENPRVKTLYRRNEHALQAAETLAAIASLHGKYEYPVEPLSSGWILMCLNMDRNTIWGSAGGMVFENDKSWDALDRFNWVQQTTEDVFKSAGNAIAGAGDRIGLFNPLNWKRNDPVVLPLAAGKSLEGIECEALPDGTVLCRPELPSTGAGGWNLSLQAPAAPHAIEFPGVIETKHYLSVIDRKTGAITSLKLKKSGRELLAGPANVIVAERPAAKMTEDPGDKMPPRPERTRLATSSDQPSAIQVSQGTVAITVEVTGTFYGGGTLRRLIRFYHDHPRIDFETELNDVPNYTIVVSEFPLAEDVHEVRRAIPYGFSHGSWAKPNPDLHGWTRGIVPAVRWIDFSLAKGGGFAIFDRGLSGRELNERIPVIYLLNAEDKYAGYENGWLSGKGKHLLPYSIVAHETAWKESGIPQMAWEYNREPVVIAGKDSSLPQSFLETSENVIVEALRREGDHLELRLVECLGSAGTATVKLNLPHRSAVLTDLTGRKLSTLPGSSPYTFQVRPQQIVTLHFVTASTLPEPRPIQSWDAFVPEPKLEALHAYDPNLIGHPPFGA